jgi:hypothetical protein
MPFVFVNFQVRNLSDYPKRLESKLIANACFEHSGKIGEAEWIHFLWGIEIKTDFGTLDA